MALVNVLAARKIAAEVEAARIAARIAAMIARRDARITAEVEAARMSITESASAHCSVEQSPEYKQRREKGTSIGCV